MLAIGVQWKQWMSMYYFVRKVLNCAGSSALLRCAQNKTQPKKSLSQNDQGQQLYRTGTSCPHTSNKHCARAIDQEGLGYLDPSPHSWIFPTISHCTKVWHRTYPIWNIPLSRSERYSFAPLQKSRQSLCLFLCVKSSPIWWSFQASTKATRYIQCEHNLRDST